MTRTIRIAALLWCCATFSGFCASNSIEPDFAVQSKIDAIALRLSKAKTESEITESLEQLHRFEDSSSDEVALIRQIVYYLKHNVTTEDRGYGAIIMMNKLRADKETKLSAALSIIESSDTYTHEIATGLLESIDAGSDGTVDFTMYEDTLR